MQIRKDDKLIPFLVLSLIALGFLFSFYGKVLLSPNEYMFSQNGDGLKNYYSLTYHIKHSSSYTNFEGMNYPYGEHTLFVGCHPALSYFFKGISEFFPFTANYSVGILNLFLLGSIFMSFLVLYWLLVELGVNRWLAIVFSLGIFLMAPQSERIAGHLALSFSCAIPLSWLLLLRQQRKPKLINLILLISNNLFWLFIHAYLGVIITSFLLLIVLAQFVLNRKEGILKKRIITIFSILIPVIFFYAFARITDVHIDRTDNPSGFFLYYAEFDNIILPSYGPLRPIWDIITFGQINLEGEGNAYVGFINVLLMAYIVVLALISIGLKGTRSGLSKFFQHKNLNAALISSFIVLICAMGIPFVQFPDWLDAFPIMKQFRAIGRFTWPFYYAFTVFAAYQFQQIISENLDKHKKLIGYGLLLVVVSMPIFEALNRQKQIATSVEGHKNLFNPQLIDKKYEGLLKHITPEKYQGIISLPFYYHGSESYERPRNGEVLKNTFIISYCTGLPSVGADLIRSSISESKNIVQLVSPNYYPKAIQPDMDPNKPFLLILTQSTLTKYESALLERAALISEMENGIALYEITPNQLFKDERLSVYQKYEELKNSFISVNGFELSAQPDMFYYNDFESSPNEINFRSNGAYSGLKEGENRLAEFDSGTFKKDSSYSLSVWMYNGMQDALNLYFRLQVLEYDEENDKWIEVKTVFPEQAETLFGDWSLVECEFKILNNNHKVFIRTIGNSPKGKTLHIDDLLITNDNIDIYRQNMDGSLFFNNHHISVMD